MDSLEFTIAENMGKFFVETFITVANLFGFIYEKVLEVVVCLSDKLAPICRIFRVNNFRIKE